MLRIFISFCRPLYVEGSTNRKNTRGVRPGVVSFALVVSTWVRGLSEILEHRKELRRGRIALFRDVILD